MIIRDILQQTGQTEQAIIRDHLTLQGFEKKSKFEAECIYFESKYGCKLEDFRKSLEIDNKEYFEKEDDLMDWEYACSSLKWWQSRLEELSIAA
ncbi:MAG: hypothetical protein HQK63_00845 [Desulfamplus sp.]|nr:hypothetical protein [Desulfamplus sp.]